MHWKANSKGYNFMFHTMVSSASIIKKKNLLNLDQKQSKDEICQELSKPAKGNTWDTIHDLIRVFEVTYHHFSCNLLCNLFCIHTAFQQVISTVSGQEKCENLVKQPLGVSTAKNDN